MAEPTIAAEPSEAALNDPCKRFLAYLQRLDRHRYQFPFEELGKMAKAIRRWLEAGGGRQALGDLEELREALKRVSEYQEFPPRRCDGREIHRRLRALSDQEVAA